MRALVYEQGNGLPTPGDYCAGGGYLYRIVSIDSRILTGGTGGNYVYATVIEADWADCAEENEYSALVRVMEDMP